MVFFVCQTDSFVYLWQLCVDIPLIEIVIGASQKAITL